MSSDHLPSSAQFWCQFPWWHFQEVTRGALSKLFHAQLLHVPNYLCGLCLVVHTCLSAWPRPTPLAVNPDRWAIISLGHLPWGCRVVGGKALCSCLCSVPSSVFPRPCSAVSFDDRGLLHPWSGHIPCLCCLWEKPVEHLKCLSSDVGYADCVFISVM